MNITVDGQNYDADKLSDETKAQIASIQAADMKLNELKRDTAMIMTARNMYVQALKKSLGQTESEAVTAKPTKKTSTTAKE